MYALETTLEALFSQQGHAWSIYNWLVVQSGFLGNAFGAADPFLAWMWQRILPVALASLALLWVLRWIRFQTSLHRLPNSLFKAVARGRFDLMPALLSQGPTLDQFGILHLMDGDTVKGSTLLFAARFGQEEILRALLEAGADPNLQAPGESSPLGTACLHGHLDAAELLLEKGADPTLLDGANGLTPLHVLARPPRHKVSEELHQDFQHRVEHTLALAGRMLELGADPAQPSAGEGLTPFQLAQRHGFGRMIWFLQDRGLSRNSQPQVS